MNLGPPPAPAFPVPTGIPSAVTLHELALLQRFAHEAGTVLEIGTHYGFSCIGMALAGAHVTSVDPHYEGPANAPDTWEPFLANVERHGLPYTGARYADLVHAFGGGVGVVEPCLTTIEAAEAARGQSPLWTIDPPVHIGATTISPRCFGIVFIDGDHVWPCPWRDAEIAMAHLTAPAYIAFHDVTPNWPGVYRAALQLAAKGWREVGRVQTLRVYQRL